MPNEFILQQTSHPEKKYNSKVLIGNWYEEKCEPHSKFSTFYQERKFEKNPYNISKLSQEPFMLSSQNWLNFQTTKPKHFETTNQREYKRPQEQVRNSVLKPSLVKKCYFDKHPSELDDYKQKWTKAPHFYDRTYIGQQK